MKVLITGGHFSPAHALINSRPQDIEIAVVGRRFIFEGDSAESPEYIICRKIGIPFFPLRTGRLQRTFSRYTLPSIAKTPLGLYDATRILQRYRPDVLVVFGGYLALPVAFAAKIMNIPIVVHEQTMSSGLANRIISRFAAKVCISYSSSREFFPAKKVVYTGNPIRKEVFSISKKIPLPANVPIIYITGGSSGSHAINRLIGVIAPQLVNHFVIIHQTGDSQMYKDFVYLEKVQSSLPEEVRSRYILKKFIDLSEIGFVLKSADLVISRSGINTVTELAALRKPCLLIPLPTGQKNEQLCNAQFAKRVGIAEYLHQNDATPEKLLKEIFFMIKNLEKYKKIYKDIEINIDADKRLWDVIKNIGAKK